MAETTDSAGVDPAAPPVAPPADPPTLPATPPVSLTPGWKTSEAWISFLVIVLGAVPSSGLSDNAPLLAKIIGMVIAALTALNYTAQRSALKRAYLSTSSSVRGPKVQVATIAALIAVVASLAVVQSSCGTTANCRDPKNAQSAQCVIEGSVVDCTGGASLSSAVAVAQPVVDKLLASALQSDGTINWSSIEPQLVDLALQYGVCVIAEIWNDYMNGTGSDSGSGLRARTRRAPTDFAKEFDRIRVLVAPGRKFKTSGATL